MTQLAYAETSFVSLREKVGELTSPPSAETPIAAYRHTEMTSFFGSADTAHTSPTPNASVVTYSGAIESLLPPGVQVWGGAFGPLVVAGSPMTYEATIFNAPHHGSNFIKAWRSSSPLEGSNVNRIVGDELDRITAAVSAQLVQTIRGQLTHSLLAAWTKGQSSKSARQQDPSARVLEFVNRELEPIRLQCAKTLTEAYRAFLQTARAATAPPTAPVEAPDSQSHPVIQDLRNWLGVTDDQLANLGHVTSRSLRNWKRGDTAPRQSSLRRFLEIHAMLAPLVRLWGVEAVNGWLHEAMPEGRSRFDGLWDPLGAAQVASDIRGIVYPTTTKREPWRIASHLEAEVDDHDISAEQWQIQQLSPPRRSRRRKR